MPAKLNIIGERYGRLVVKADAEPFFTSGGNRLRQVVCECECGDVRPYRLNSLRSGNTKSCGCLKEPHGQSSHPLFNTWTGMKSRCYNPKDKFFDRYGARGISVCDRWVNDPAAFFKDMGPKPTKAHMLERRDNDGSYSPDNCIWATPTEQANNKSNNRIIEYEGKSYTIAELSRKTGIGYDTIKRRLYAGYSMSDILSNRNMKKKQIDAFGKSQSMTDWSKESGIGIQTIACRLNREGWCAQCSVSILPGKGKCAHR